MAPHQKASRVWEFFFRIGGPYSEQVSINGIPEEAIAYNYKEVGINDLAELRCAKVQLGIFLYVFYALLFFTFLGVVYFYVRWLAR